MNDIFWILLLSILAGGILIFSFGFTKKFLRIKDVHGWHRVKRAAADELWGD